MLLVGCNQEPNPETHDKWVISFYLPSGELFETHEVLSVKKPTPSDNSGGTMNFIDRGAGGYKDWEHDLTLPSTWGYKIERSDE